MLPRLLSWFIFSLFIGLSPLISNWISLLNRNIDIRLDTLIGKGELYLFVAAISAGAIGELLASRTERTVLSILSGGAATLILYLCASQYADISSSLQIFPLGIATEPQSAPSLDPQKIASGSLIFLGFGIITSASCIGVSTSGRKPLYL